MYRCGRCRLARGHRSVPLCETAKRTWVEYGCGALRGAQRKAYRTFAGPMCVWLAWGWLARCVGWLRCLNWALLWLHRTLRARWYECSCCDAILPYRYIWRLYSSRKMRIILCDGYLYLKLHVLGVENELVFVSLSRLRSWRPQRNKRISFSLLERIWPSIGVNVTYVLRPRMIKIDGDVFIQNVEVLRCCHFDMRYLI